MGKYLNHYKERSIKDLTPSLLPLDSVPVVADLREDDQESESIKDLSPIGKEIVVKKGAIFSVLFVLFLLSASHAEMFNVRSLLNAPEDYEGKTVLLGNTKLDGEIARNRHFGFYCLGVEIQGRYVPGYLYRSQLNFVIFSEELAGKLISRLKQPIESHGKRLELMDHLSDARAFLVRLTCKIERFRGHWVADVKRVELYGKQGRIIETIE